MVVRREGLNSKMVVNGDITQIDLPSGKRSGLLDVIDVLRGVEGISFIHFDERDVVRHSLVQRIVKAYERYNEMTGAARQLSLKLPDPTPPHAAPAEPLDSAPSRRCEMSASDELVLFAR